MLERLEIEQEVLRCLNYTQEEAATRQLTRITEGWEMQYGYFPVGVDNPLQIVVDASDVLHNYVSRRMLSRRDVIVDPVVFVTQRPPLPVQMIGGIGLWLPTSNNLTTEVG